MFLEPLSKMFLMIHLYIHHTLHPVAFKSVDDSTSVLHGILILWSHQEVFDCFTSLEIDLHPMVVTNVLETFTEPFLVRNNDVWFLVGVSPRVLWIAVIVIFVGRVPNFHFYPIEGPCWILAGR